MLRPAPDPPTRVFLVRHGAARGAEGVAVGHVDLPLSETGATSVRRLARSWRGAPPDRLVASDLARAAGTAEILGEGWDLSLESEPRLREMDFGDWDGERWSTLRQRHGAALEEWMGAWWHQPAPGGEGFGDVAVRARGWLEEVLESARGQTVVAVGHGGSIRTLLCHLLEMPLRRAFQLHLDHGRVSAFGTGIHGIEVQLVNADRFPEPAGGR